MRWKYFLFSIELVKAHVLEDYRTIFLMPLRRSLWSTGVWNMR